MSGPEIRRRDRPRIMEHNDTIESMFFVRMEELRKDTLGGYLQFFGESVMREGAVLEPHSHDSDEFYYLLEGSGTMMIDGESAQVDAGELVRIAPNLVHSLRADRGSEIRMIAFGISYMPEDRLGYTAYPVDGGEPRFVSTLYS